jgi:formyltetrahydrofolate deformylase
MADRQVPIIMKEITFLVQCSDSKGLLAGISSFFYDKNFNILSCQQHTDLYTDKYFMRIKLDMSDLKMSRNDLETSFAKFAEPFNLEWSVRYSDSIPKIAIMVSRTSHCLYDILQKKQEGDLRCEIPLIISNHPDLEFVADQFKIPYYCFPVTKETKHEQEKQVLELIDKHHVDLVVMARYMQILSENFIKKYNYKIINIHHAFLPAFQGARPYMRAYEKGVKLIGATAHYATVELDEGPIIAQDVERVSHESSPDDLKRIGKDIERRVLSEAIRVHLDNQIIITNNRTIIFSA